MFFVELSGGGSIHFKIRTNVLLQGFSRVLMLTGAEVESEHNILLQ